MRKMAKAVAVTAAIAASAEWGACASAAVLPYTQLDQSRSIEVNVSARGNSSLPPVTDGANETSEAIGSFYRAMEYQVTAHEPPPGLNGATAQGSARQEVVFGETSIFGSLAAEVHVTHTGGTSNATADSQFRTRFTVARDTPFTLAGQVSLSSGGAGTVGQYLEIFLLTGQGPEPGQSESFVMIGNAGGNGGGGYLLDTSGVFHPGWIYTLNVQLMGAKSTEGTVGADKLVTGIADFALTVPEPTGLATAFIAATLLLPRRRQRRRSPGRLEFAPTRRGS